MKELIDILSKTAPSSVESFVFLGQKLNGNWVDYPIKWLNFKDEIKGMDFSSGDWYYCPHHFKKPNRKKEDCIDVLNFLWADIDQGEVDKIEPSILVESSPGRFQAIWWLSDTWDKEYVESVNQQVSYFIGADKSGWDITQYLRMPGTRNTKYANNPKVRIVYRNRTQYDIRSIAKRVESVEIKTSSSSVGGTIEDEKNLTWNRLMPKLRRKLSAANYALLRQKKCLATDDRSAILYRMMHSLVDAGLNSKECYDIIRQTCWNKYRGQSRESTRLLAEFRKVMTSKIDFESLESSVDDEEGWTVEKAIAGLDHEFSMTPWDMDVQQKWLIEDCWTNNSHGIIGGDPKTMKTFIALEMAVSIASGRPFLQRYNVNNPGPVLFIQEENSRNSIANRLQMIKGAKGIGLSAEYDSGQLRIRKGLKIPIYIANQSGMILDEEGIERIEMMGKSLGVRMIFLDPLYMMIQADLSNQKELTPVLRRLLEMKDRLGCSLAILHHKRKTYEGQKGSSDHVSPAMSFLGSVVLPGWYDSMFALSRMKDGSIKWSRNYRSAQDYEDHILGIDINDEKGLIYDLTTVDEWKEEKKVSGELKEDKEGKELSEFQYQISMMSDSILNDIPGMSHRELVDRITSVLGRNDKPNIGRAIKALTDSGYISKINGKLYVSEEQYINHRKSIEINQK